MLREVITTILHQSNKYKKFNIEHYCQKKTEPKVNWSKGNEFFVTNNKEKKTANPKCRNFSKATPQQKQKDVMTLATIVVKADVHVSDDLVKAAVTKTICKTAPNSNGKKKQKSKAMLSVLDDIQLIRSESLSPPPVSKRDNFLTPKRCRPKWSMRVKLQSYSGDETLPGGDLPSEDDGVFSPRSSADLKKCSLKSKGCKSSDEHDLDDRKSHKRKRKSADESEELRYSKRSERRKGRNSKIPKTLKDDAKTEKILAELQSESKARKRSRGRARLSLSKAPENAEPGENKKVKGAEEESDDRGKASSRLSSARESREKDENIDDDPIVALTDDELLGDADEEITIDSDCETLSVESTKRKPLGKLAPLFVKRLKPDPAVLAARRGFLKSGVPKNIKKVMERKPSSGESGNCALPFPKISHVLQVDAESSAEDSLAARQTFLMKVRKEYHPVSLDATRLKCIIGLESADSSSRIPKEQESVRMEKADVEDALTDIEKRCADARSIWQRITEAKSGDGGTAERSKKGRKRKSLRSLSPLEGEDESVNPTWTRKYRPTSTAHNVGNEAAALKLRGWLDDWRLPSKQDDDEDKCSSGDEFCSSDCSLSGGNGSNRVAVLLGPHGSGKTASVYAVAEELGYRVLEVNASSRRTGKKILMDFQEATKSHRVKKNHGQALLITVPQKAPQKKVPENSLILIEDVDLIFDEDEGFVSAMFQLAASTKRPIVMTCSEHCPHLSKLAPRQLLIYYEAAIGARVSALLELITLAESGCRLPPSCLKALSREGDLRKALLQLQYLLLSGAPTGVPQGASSTFWSDVKTSLYKPAVKLAKKLKKQESEREANARLLESLADGLDSVSLIATLVDVNDPAPPSWLPKLTPGLSLGEDDSAYRGATLLGPEMAEWLRSATLRGDDGATPGARDDDARVAERRRLRVGVDCALSQVAPMSLDHRPLAVDYLPAVRTICRSEEERSATRAKRGNRFRHYLRTLDFPYASMKPNILAAACAVMQERTKKGRDACGHREETT